MVVVVVVVLVVVVVVMMIAQFHDFAQLTSQQLVRLYCPLSTVHSAADCTVHSAVCGVLPYQKPKVR